MKTIVDDLNPHLEPPYNFKAFIQKGETKSLTSTTHHGEFLVPKHVTERFESLLSQYSVMRGLARVDSVSTDTFEMLKDKDMADCGWVEEAQERVETELGEFVQQKIFIHELYAKPKVSQKLLDDASIDVESWLTQKIAEKMALIENEAFIRGDGNNKPKGFLTYAQERIEVIEGNNSDAFLRAQEKMQLRFHQKAVWLVSPSALAFIRALKEETSGRYLWQPQFSESQPATLFGHKIVVCEQMPPLSSPCAIAFASFYDAYQIVDRMDLSIMRDPYSAKPFVEFYARKRIGGDVINPDAIKLITLRS